MRKSRLMLDVQAQHPEKGKDLEVWFPPMVEEFGFTETAKRLGIAKATAENWLLKMGKTSTRKVVPVGEGD